MIDVIFFHRSRGLSVSLLSVPFGANARRSRAENHKKKKDWHPLQISIPRYFLPHPADVQHALDARNSPSRLLVRGSWTAALVGLVRQRIGPPRARVSSASIIALQVQFPRFIFPYFIFMTSFFLAFSQQSVGIRSVGPTRSELSGMPRADETHAGSQRRLDTVDMSGLTNLNITQQRFSRAVPGWHNGAS